MEIKREFSIEIGNSHQNLRQRLISKYCLVYLQLFQSERHSVKQQQRKDRDFYFFNEKDTSQAFLSTAPHLS